jgi:hypothetical protein
MGTLKRAVTLVTYAMMIATTMTATLSKILRRLKKKRNARVRLLPKGYERMRRGYARPESWLGKVGLTTKTSNYRAERRWM